MTGRRQAGSAGRPARFDGWIIVGAVFTQFVANAGLGFYGLAIYLEAIIDNEGFSNASVSGAASTYFLTSALVGRMIARPVERGHIRGLVMSGGIISGVALALLGRVHAVWQLYALYVAFATGFAMAGIIAGTTLVTRWFHAKRSIALAIASSGLSVGGLTLTQFSSWLIGDVGFRAATPWLGGILIVVTLATSTFYWPDPAARGQLPDGAPPLPDGESTATPGVPYARAVRSRFFWAATAGMFFAMFGQVGGITHIANLGAERFDRGVGASAVLALALASVISRLLGGIVARNVPLGGFAVAMAATQGLSLWIVAFADHRAMLLAGACLLGATTGNLLMLQTLLIAEAFGVVAYARLFSLNQLVVTLGLACGPFAMGALHDAVDYRASYLVAGACGLAGACLIGAGGGVARAQNPPS